MKQFNRMNNMKNHVRNRVRNHTTQEEVLRLVQQAGDKVAEAMNIISDVGARFGITVHFEHFEQSVNQAINRASDGISDGISDDESNEVLARLSTGTSDMLSDEEKANIVTLSELAEMISDETDIEKECALEVLEGAFDLIEEYGLILDLGSWDSYDSYDDNCDDHDCGCLNPSLCQVHF